MANKTLLKYAGNKRNIMQLISPFFGDLNVANRYIEPFCGAMGSSLNVDAPSSVQIILSDSNWELINFYEQVKLHAVRVEEIANSWNNSKESFYEIRNWDRNPLWKDQHSLQEIAARTLFLNRNCFNGLFRINRHGHFTTPWGHPTKQVKIKVTDNVQALQILERASVSCSDWKLPVRDAKEGDVLYCDPPYVDLKNPHNEFGGYVGSFGWTTQVQLRDELLAASKRGARVVTSNSWCNDTLELYKDFNIECINASRSLSSNGNSRGSIKELVAWL
jgi:DNA adenine methylase